MTCENLNTLFKSELSILELDERELTSLVKIYALDKLNRNALSINDALSNEQVEMVIEDLQKLKKHIPIQYITQTSWFYGLKFFVNESVLIPRPETEELVDWIKNDLGIKNETLKILDIGTGSGCIALALKHLIPHASVVGWDVSIEALKVAEQNAHDLNLEVNFEEVDIRWGLEKLTPTNRDVIVSNPPYITPTEQKLMTKSTLLHEPDLALFVDVNDPLLFYRLIADYSRECLKADGALFFEINEFFAAEVIALLYSKGFKNIELRQDMQNKDRMIKARI